MLFCGRLSYAGYVERAALEERVAAEELREDLVLAYGGLGRRGVKRGYLPRCECGAEQRVGAVLPAEDNPDEGSAEVGAGFALGEVCEPGKLRTGMDTRCKCERPLPQVLWLGYDVPLERWCLLCGRALPRPLDRKFLPVVGRDVIEEEMEVVLR